MLKKYPNKIVAAELVAPAGNLEKMETAFLYGADAVYLGIPDFSLRVRINDFTLVGIAKAVKLAKSLGKKVYVTANILAHNGQLESLPAYFRQLNKLRIDALIISDPGVMVLAKRYAPKVPIHLSTQANCTNSEAAKFWYGQGVKRVVLAREVTLPEIKEIKAACPKLELECFIHGAMCMAYSGRCFLSKELTDRSANSGDCTQPCRWQHDRILIKSRGHDDEFELVEEKHGSYLLNSKDLRLIEYLPQLLAAGVSAFKVEGRAKSAYYLANVIGIYRRALGMCATKKGRSLASELARLAYELEDKVVNRGYTTGFMLNPKVEAKVNMQNQADSKQISRWEFCGQVMKSRIEAEKQRLTLTIHNTLKSGDQAELVLPGYEIVSFTVGKIIDAATKEELDEVHGGAGRREAIIEIPSLILAPKGTVIRRFVNI